MMACMTDTPTMNKQQTHAFKLQLLAQRDGMLAQLAALRGGTIGRAQASAEHFGNPEDPRAEMANARALEFALDAHETAALDQIDAALRRIDSGLYGDCIDCAAPIGMERLRATPQALRCIACQQGFEAA